MYESVKAGRIVFEESLDTLSDGTSGGVEENSVTFSSLCVLYSTFWVYKIRSVSGISLRRSLSLFVLNTWMIGFWWMRKRLGKP